MSNVVKDSRHSQLGNMTLNDAAIVMTTGITIIYLVLIGARCTEKLKSRIKSV